MKRYFAVTSVIVCLSGVPGLAAIFKLENAVDGSNSILLPPGGTAQINIILETQESDTVPIHFLFAMMDCSNPDIVVTSVEGGLEWAYDRSYSFPVTLGRDYFEPDVTEYSLNAGEFPTGFCMAPLQPGSREYLVETLTLYNSGTSDETATLMFETGFRQPFAFGCGPEYFPFITAVQGFPPNFPNTLYIGDGYSNNPPLYIQLGNIVDCNDNGISDAQDLINQTSFDCNANGAPDECDVESGASEDVNGNAQPDECEPPVITGASSRVVHGPLGELIIKLELDGNVTTDPRIDAGKIIEFEFGGALDPSLATDKQRWLVERATGGQLSTDDLQVDLNADGQSLRLTFPGLPDERLANEDLYLFDFSALGVVGLSTVELRLLAGDLNGDGSVDPLDAGRVQTRFGESIGPSPAFDINNDGIAIDPMDSAAILARLGDASP